MNRPLRLGTRGSPLALAQAQLVASALRSAHGWGEDAIEIVPITTTGDVIYDRPLTEIGGKVLWTKELDRCLSEGRTDISVHSMKDVETVRPERLTLAAYLPRDEVTDRLIGADSLEALREGAVVGTSSPRRKAQLLSRRPDLEIVSIRGNVQTRISKVGSEVEATLLASAGLNRLGLNDVGSPLPDLLPAPAQGAVGVEVLASNEEVAEMVRPITHERTRACVEAERAFLLGIGGNCHSPIAAMASASDEGMHLKAEILSADGREVHRIDEALYGDDGYAPGDLALDLLSRASPELRSLFAS
jgi:hydroxymethylbilane synthase